MQPKQAFIIAEQFGTPVYVYGEELLKKAAREALSFKAPFGLTVLYAMKANPNRRILEIFQQMGIQIDASSEYEVLRCLHYGIPGEQILLTTQELPRDLAALIQKGVQFNACSLHQLEAYGKQFPGTALSIRINPGEGSGFDARVNVGGKESSFGIWHEHIPQALELIEKYELTIKRLHTHIGSGTNPEVWARVAEFSLSFLEYFPHATILNLGGGFKVARIPSEKDADMNIISKKVNKALLDFAEKTGRKMRLEIEPGTFLVANAGVILSRIQDKTSTGINGYTFLKLDTGMTEIIRPSYYGSQHTMQVIQREPTEDTEEVLVVGHCCESADLLTPSPDHGDEVFPRLLPKAQIGDLFLIEGCGAYCSSMSTANYNSFPRTAEVMIRESGELELIRRRETLEKVLELEE
ncbi:MAG: diaminopimelate decarboxylase [Candidatus Gracilibacteria bacterium]